MKLEEYHYPVPVNYTFPVKDLMDAGREQELARRVRAGDRDAREEMIVANIPLALKMAGEFTDRAHPFHGPAIKSAALDGLIHAVDKYRPGFLSRGRAVRFSTYAVRWIRQHMLVAAHDEIPLIRVPARMSPSMFSRVYSDDDGGDDARPGPGHDLRSFAWPNREHDSHRATPDIDRALAMLARDSLRQAQVIRLMYPLDGDEPMELTEAGRVMGTTRQTANSTRKRATEKLRGYMEMEGVA